MTHCTTCRIKPEWHIITQTPFKSALARIQGLRRGDAHREAQRLSLDFQTLGWHLAGLGPERDSSFALYFSRDIAGTLQSRSVFAQRVYRVTLCDDVSCPQRSELESRFTRLPLAERYPSADELAHGVAATTYQAWSRHILAIASDLAGEDRSRLVELASDLDTLITSVEDSEAATVQACITKMEQLLPQMAMHPQIQERLQHLLQPMQQWPAVSA